MKNEKTSNRVSSVAAKGLRGPRTKDVARGMKRWIDRHMVTVGLEHSEVARFAVTETLLQGARWWHRKVKAAVASALSQSPDRGKGKRR